MSDMKIHGIQMNPTVGDIDSNAAKIRKFYDEAVADGAELVVFPECALTGYPLGDLVLNEAFVVAAMDKSRDIFNPHVDKVPVIFGSVAANPRGETENVAIVYDPSNLIVYRSVSKTKLPNYGVFDEVRHFKAATNNTTPIKITVGGKRVSVGILICEDSWYPEVGETLAHAGAEILVVINGSPFEEDKMLKRLAVISDLRDRTKLPIIYVNMVGGQDELVFDGRSFGLMSRGGYMRVPATMNEEVVRFVVSPATIAGIASNVDIPLSYTEARPYTLAAIYYAMVVGLRDYLSKSGFKKVLLGYSGGVDSGLVAAIACDAIGAENVLLVSLPSKYSSDHSKSDAATGAKLLGCELRTVAIEPVVQSFRDALLTDISMEVEGVADENLQPRARGTILMAISNQENRLLLSTGNKSEVAVGYSTLYGDMCGGFNPLKDCYKTLVWELCRWRNSLNNVSLTEHALSNLGIVGEVGRLLGVDGVVVPEEIIAKPPSAELRPDQQDTDSLPPYEVLDAILKLMVEHDKANGQIIADGFDAETVVKVRKLFNGAEHKRRQAPMGVKITSRTFISERRYPVVNRWHG